MSKQTMKIFQECAPVFSMLSDENRQKILILLFDNGEMTVNEITAELTLSRPAISHHLKLLLDIKLVKVKKVGKERYYSVDLYDSLMLLKKLTNSIESDYISKKSSL